MTRCDIGSDCQPYLQPTITNVSQFVFLLGGDIKYNVWREALRQPLYLCLAFTLQEHKNSAAASCEW